MKNKLIFRILGALSSSLIIVSVFVPYVKVLNNTQSLWQEYTNVGAMYLPIMIIVFGAIAVILFSINIKTELVYSSVGALIFFLIMQTMTIMNQGAFKNLNVGYYFLCAGTLLTGIMAFICSLRVKQTKEVVESPKEESLLTQIDKLYGEQNTSNDELQNNNLDEIIQPIQIQSNSIDLQPISLNINQPIVDANEINNIPDVIPTETINNVENLTNEVLEKTDDTLIKTENIIPTEFAVSNEVGNGNVVDNNLIQNNQVVAEFSNPIVNDQSQILSTNNVINPVVSEFSIPKESVAEPVINVDNNLMQDSIPSNPVVSEFGGVPVLDSLEGDNSSVDLVQPLSNTTLTNVVQENSKAESNLDIFS